MSCLVSYLAYSFPDNKVHGANMGPIWGRQDPGGPHVGPVNLDIWVWLNGSIVSICLNKAHGVTCFINIFCCTSVDNYASIVLYYMKTHALQYNCLNGLT